MLGGMGAEVIHIETPGGNDYSRHVPPFLGPQGLHFGPQGEGEMSLWSLNRGRNKKSVTLNLKSPEGLALFHKLVAQSDVVIENFSAGTVQRLGVDYEAVKAINPRIIYASISAFGEQHAYEGIKGVDILVQAASGLLEATGFSDGPPTRVGLPISDLVTPLYAVNGILAAIIQRFQTGVGQHVKVAMLDCMASLLACEHLDITTPAGLPPRTGNSMDRLVPFGVYACNDGHVAITAHQQEKFQVLMVAIGQPALTADPRFTELGKRRQHAFALNQQIEHWTKQHTTAQVIEVLWKQYSIPTVTVRTPAEVVNCPGLLANGALQPLAQSSGEDMGIMANGNPIRFSNAQAQFDQPAQPLGASNTQVYTELLGLLQHEITALHERGVI